MAKVFDTPARSFSSAANPYRAAQASLGWRHGHRLNHPPAFHPAFSGPSRIDRLRLRAMMASTAKETIVGTIPAPLLSEVDYPSFRLLLDNQIPASFAEWRCEADKEDCSCGTGDSVKRIPVTPQELASYCLSNRLHPTPHSLRACAAVKYECQQP